MIGMSFADALFVYFLLWLIFLAILWWRELSRVKSYEWHLSNSRLFHCDSCPSSHLSFYLQRCYPRHLHRLR